MIATSAERWTAIVSCIRQLADAYNTGASRIVLVLCDGMVDACQVPMIREHFADALGAAGWPDGACLFLSTRHTRSRRVRGHDSAVAEAVFFSPVAIAVVPHLIAVCGAEPSPPPDGTCAMLLVGKPSDWELLPRRNHGRNVAIVLAPLTARKAGPPCLHITHVCMSRRARLR